MLLFDLRNFKLWTSIISITIPINSTILIHFVAPASNKNLKIIKHKTNQNSISYTKNWHLIAPLSLDHTSPPMLSHFTLPLSVLQSKFDFTKELNPKASMLNCWEMKPKDNFLGFVYLWFGTECFDLFGNGRSRKGPGFANGDFYEHAVHDVGPKRNKPFKKRKEGTCISSYNLLRSSLFHWWNAKACTWIKEVCVCIM